ncbi:ATP-binding cassette domain-containing protein [Nocardioides sp. cx-169]|uniref:ATP-binding cassette domain-containing protein n=1 Tax=Nocardioides sp. cx-169 TaxID=2899080 RepID=UPI001E47ADDD|nr:ATP-binding cassette domain-containing protein [Nocardioides sp. cx-169]MCD4534254.1 ATP-binding cassette domain-containing protein [Nocardioides sp. cx-169]
MDPIVAGWAMSGAPWREHAGGVTEPAVRVVGLRKTYGTKVEVDDVSFEVHPGEIFGILGPNGSGKSTTVESVAGLRVGDSGGVRVHGVDPWVDRAATTRLVGIQLQKSALQPKITVREALALWGPSTATRSRGSPSPSDWALPSTSASGSPPSAAVSSSDSRLPSR